MGGYNAGLFLSLFIYLSQKIDFFFILLSIFRGCVILNTLFSFVPFFCTVLLSCPSASPLLHCKGMPHGRYRLGIHSKPSAIFLWPRTSKAYSRHLPHEPSDCGASQAAFSRSVKIILPDGRSKKLQTKGK